MKKLTVIINGSGGVGKDTVCEIIGKTYFTMNVSSIDPIKKIASEYGWNGEKTEKSRKFLSDLKQIFVEFNDMPNTYLLNKYEEFLTNYYRILFVHIREPHEIKKFKESINNDCITLLIRRDINKEWNNKSDDEVENYDYDFIYNNNLPLEQMEEDVLKFFKDNIFIL